MPGITVSQQIDAAPELVFQLASNVERWTEFIGGITKTEILSDGPVGVGTRFKETRVMMGRESSEVMEFTQFEPPHRYVVEAESCGTHYVTEFKFESCEGGTLVTMVFDGRPLSLVSRVFSVLMLPLTKGLLVKCLREDLEDLKKAAQDTNRTPVATQ